MIKPLLLAAVLTGIVAGNGYGAAEAVGVASAREEIIVPVSISLVAKGRMLDFRYRVADEEKANALLSHKIKPALIVESDGSHTGVLKSPKVGSLRTTRPHQKEKLYFMLFGNPAMKVKPGDKVTVVIGDFRAEHLTVQ